MGLGAQKCADVRGARVAHFWGAAKAALLLPTLAAATSRNTRLPADASTGPLGVRGAAPETAGTALPADAQTVDAGLLLLPLAAACAPCCRPVFRKTP